MPKHDLTNKKVAILATDGVEQVELTKPWQALNEAGANTTLLSIKSGDIKAWDKKDWGETFTVDGLIENASPSEYDAVVLPGGVMNPDHLRMNEAAVDFVGQMFDDKKPIAAICHGPWLLIEADVVSGKRVTSYPSLQTDLLNAGADWVDEEVVVDQGMVTSRNPHDLPAFIDKMLEEIAEGPHQNM